jgi:DnaD/phage-associated family protein
MARPQKVGLLYFPLDVDIFEDPKVEKVTSQFGPIGDGILVRLLCRIYRGGYCTAFDEDVARSIALKVGDRELFATVIQIVEKLLQAGFFDEGMYREHGILTSRGIQKRYERACADSGRKISRVPDCHRLLGAEPALPGEETEVLEAEIPLEDAGDYDENGLPAGNHGLPGWKPVFAAQETPQRKEKKSIEFDVDDVREYARARARGVGREWQASFGRAPTPAQLEVMERWVREYGGAGMEPDVFTEAMRRAATAGAGNPIAYIGALLVDWRRQRLRTLDDVDAAQYQFDHAAGKV